MKIRNKFAIGCLVQWYEIELIEEYLQSIKNAVDVIDNKENVVIDLYFNCSQALEKVDEEQITISEIKDKYFELLNTIFGYHENTLSLARCDYNIKSVIDDNVDGLYTIANYRRDFNNKYCTEVDVIMWGETDALIPKQTFEVLDLLHNNNIENKINKYVAFFGTCKMWDDSWKVLEHTEFTDKPFIGGDEENWWSLRYNMNIDEMNAFNDKVEDLDIRTTQQYKFNGCGLVISSDLVKSGANMPKSVFFIHEDTAFMLQLQKLFNGQVPQYIIKNILLVHNRKHKKKRMYVLGESKIEAGDIGAARLEHDWYKKASEMSHHNTYNMFNQSKIYTWGDVFK